MTTVLTLDAATLAVQGPGSSDLRAVEWKAFSFAHGHFLLHVPSSHVLEVPAALAEEVRGERSSVEASAELERLAELLPRPSELVITPDIRAISLNMAQGCNLRCTYCFAGEGDYGKKGMMSFDVATAAIALLSEGKDSFHVVFFGGEPMLNFSVVEQVVAWSEQRAVAGPYPKMSWSMTTNGTLLTAEKMTWLKEKKFALNLSYDGNGVHAKQRLSKDKTGNSEALVERKLALFQDQLAQLQEFRLRATVTKANLHLLEEAVVATLTSYNYKMFVSHHATSERGVEFAADDVAYLGAILRRVVDRFLAAGDYSTLLRLENIKQAVRNIHRGKTRGMACGAGINYLTVSVSGSFYLCHRFNEDESECVGGINKGLNQASLNAVATFRGAKQAPCNTCWMRQWCAGGCMHEHKSAHGDKFSIDSRYCQLQNLELTEAMRVYSVLRREAPQLLEA